MVPEELTTQPRWSTLMITNRHIRMAPTLLVLLFGGYAMGQGVAPESDSAASMDATRQLLQEGREDIIRDELRLTEDEAAAFWPTYQYYQRDLHPIRDRYTNLLREYIDSYRAGTVSEEFANQMVDDYLEIQTDIIDIKKKYIGDFRKALPARKATRFYQLENKMEAEVAAQLSLVVPLIDPV
jgi:hypothetical protein